jgi:uncharacterized metal-binding protein YceD (DUF177 family)
MKARPPHESQTSAPHKAKARAFSRLLDVHDVPAGGLRLTIEAPSETHAAIAAECDIPAVATLEVRYAIEPRAGGRFEMTGRLKARVTQVCVVSLEPFESDLIQEIELTFAPADGPEPEWPGLKKEARRDQKTGRVREAAPAPPPPGNDDQVDPPEPIVDGKIDLGAVALEFLSLALDPYPKKPGVAFDDIIVDDGQEETPSSFAALAHLKDPARVKDES